MTHQIDPPEDWTVTEWPIVDAAGSPVPDPRFWSVSIRDGHGNTIAARTVPLPLTDLEKRLEVRSMFAEAMSRKDALS